MDNAVTAVREDTFAAALDSVVVREQRWLISNVERATNGWFIHVQGCRPPATSSVRMVTSETLIVPEDWLREHTFHRCHERTVPCEVARTARVVDHTSISADVPMPRIEAAACWDAGELTHVTDDEEA